MTQLWWGRALRERGDGDVAKAHFDEALGQLEACGYGAGLEWGRRFAEGAD